MDYGRRGVEVFHTNRTDGTAIVDAARRTGQEQGCEQLLLVEEADGGGMSYEGGHVFVAGPLGATVGSGLAQANGENRVRFLCAVETRR